MCTPSPIPASHHPRIITTKPPPPEEGGDRTPQERQPSRRARRRRRPVGVRVARGERVRGREDLVAAGEGGVEGLEGGEKG